MPRNLSTLSLVLTAVLLTLTAIGSALRPHLTRAPPPVVAAAGDTVRLEVRPSHSLVADSGGELYAEVTLHTAGAEHAQGPVSMAIVLDRSGSMAGTKLSQAKAAAKSLVAKLRPDDELTVVHFGTDVVESAPRKMDDAGREALTAFIDGVESEGGTNISGALEHAARALRDATGTRRIVLISDGQPTAGVTSEPELVNRVGAIHHELTAVTALGVGLDFNPRLMQQLADRGGGLYGFLQDTGRLDEVLALEVGQARDAYAGEVVLELATPPGVTVEELPGRDIVRSGAVTSVRLADLKSADDVRVYARLSTTAAFDADAPLFTAKLHWVRCAGDQRGRPGSTEVKVEVAGTDDPRLVDQSKDEKVFAAAVRAVGSRHLVEAAAAFERGDRALAFSLLDDARNVFGMSADALAGEVADVRSVRSRWEQTTDETARRVEARGLERKKLTNFGKESYGY